jgi:hypothetical protein
MSSYKTIEGKRLSSKMIDEATRLVGGAGDGRISLKDAEMLMGMVKEDNILTDVERDTIDYLFENFRWTPVAEEWFRHDLKHWQSHKPPVPITLAELSKKHFAKKDVFSEPSARNARKRALETATSETNQDHDEIGLWIRLEDGITVEVFSNFIELADDFVQLRGGALVPVSAIEKVEI